MNKEDIENLIDNKIQFAEKKYGAEVKNLLIETLCLEKMLKPDATAIKEQRIIPVTKWNDYHPYPSKGALRMLIHHAETNGFKEFGVVKRDGKRVLIDEQAYFRWREMRNNEKLA